MPLIIKRPFRFRSTSLSWQSEYYQRLSEEAILLFAMKYHYPQTWNEYPNLPWIHFMAADGGGFHVRDMRSGHTFFASNMAGVHQFAADHSSGAGNAVHGVTQRMGIKRCGKCAQRQAAMNGFTQKLKSFFS
jgi:hypothetical protein